MAYTFADDMGQLTELCSYLSTSKKDVENIINEIYGLIEGELNTHWSGVVYNQFVSNCRAYKPTLDELVNLLNAFQQMLDQITQKAEALNSEVAAACNI